MRRKYSLDMRRHYIILVLLFILVVCAGIYIYIYKYRRYEHFNNSYDGLLKAIPNINKNALHYVFEDLNIQHDTNKLWLEFGVASGNTINYISKFTEHNVYGFDSFEGLPEFWRDGFDKKTFDRQGIPPEVNKNVILIKGLIQDTLQNFLQEKDQKISFMHIDTDLYSAAKHILFTTLPYLDNNCVVVFDELVNYPGYEEGELKALDEFLKAHDIKYKWIGMHGIPFDPNGNQNVAIILNYTA